MTHRRRLRWAPSGRPLRAAGAVRPRVRSGLCSTAVEKIVVWWDDGRDPCRLRQGSRASRAQKLGVEVGVVVRPWAARCSVRRGPYSTATRRDWSAMTRANLPALVALPAQSAQFALGRPPARSGVKVTNATLTEVPFDLEHWTKVAAEQYPDGLPEPHSDDPTQWLFKGTIPGSTAPLQVAVARLLGYRWPDQEPDDLDELADDDGIVPLPSVARRDAGGRAPSRPARPRLWIGLVAGAARSTPRRGRLAGRHPRVLAARRLLRPARSAVRQPALHLAGLGRPQGRLLGPPQLPSARRPDPREADLHLSQRLDRAAASPSARSPRPRLDSSPHSAFRAS